MGLCENLALFGPAELKFEQANFQKCKCPGVGGCLMGGGGTVLMFRIDRCVSALWVRVNQKMSTISSEN